LWVVWRTLLVGGFVLPAVMEGISLSQQAGRIAKTQLEASGLAQAKLNEIVVSGDWNMSGASGDFPDHPGYKWEVQVLDRDSSYSVVQVSVRVTWLVRAQERSVTLSTFVYNIANAINNGTSNAGGTIGGQQ
jgi:hypothetical protein